MEENCIAIRYLKNGFPGFSGVQQLVDSQLALNKTQNQVVGLATPSKYHFSLLGLLRKMNLTSLSTRVIKADLI